MKIAQFIQKSPIMPVLMAAKEMQSLLDVQLQRLDINVVDGLVLTSIFFEGRHCKPSEIAKFLELSRSQVSQSIKRLETSGLLERSLNKTDSRVMNLKLTATGKSKSQKVVKIFDDLTRTVDAIFGEDLSEKIAPKLLKLREKLQTR